MADAPNVGTPFPGQAPVAEAVPSGPENMGAWFDQLAEDAAKASLPADPDVEVETRGEDRPRAENGRFTAVPKPENSADDAGETENAAVEAALNPNAVVEAGTADPETPDGEAEDPATAPALALPLIEGDPMVPLKVKVGETEMEGVPALEVTFTANGKERTERLDKLTRLAIDGIYSEQREQRYKGMEQEATASKQEAAELRAQVQQVREYVEAIMADEGAYLTEKDAWDAENTPQKRAEKLERQLHEERHARQLDAISQSGRAYFEGTLTPALDVIAKALPMVATEELVARLGFEVSRLHGGRGYLTPDQYEAVNRYVIEDLAPWAKQLNEHRSSRFTPKDAVAKTVSDAQAAKAKAEKEQADAQKSKKKVAQAMKPVGSASASPPANKPKRNAVTVDEAMDDAVADAVRSVMQPG